VSRYILDNTVTMAWCFEDETTALSEAILDRLTNLTDIAYVPDLWLYEVVNVTELAVRRGRISDQKAQDFLQRLAELPIGIESPTRSRVFNSVRALASQYKLTAYDAAYLELAIRQNLPLATFDTALAQAAGKAGIPLVDR
jgi:predicted nucleic acid-binding protein